MAGISSKALNGVSENNKKYNGIELTPELELNLYDAEYRELDPSIARWWQIDPVTDVYEGYSPYASMYNNPIRISDPLGDEGEECCGGLKDALVDAADNVLLTASGLVNGMLNTVSGGLISTDPFGVRGALSAEKQLKYDAAVVVGQVGPLFSAAGGRFTSGRAPALQTTNGVVVELPVTARPSIAPSKTVEASGNSQGGKGAQNAKVNQPSKVEKKTNKETIGTFTKKTEVRPSKESPGQSRAEYVRYKNKDGKTIRTYKDSYDRANKFQGRKPLSGGPEGRPAN